MNFEIVASKEMVEKTMTALKHRHIHPEFVEGEADALERIKQMIPAGAEVMTGGSTSLDVIGFTDLLISKKHPWKNLKEEILAEADKMKQAELRKRSVTSQFFLGSVHAVTENGEVLVASATGSQIPAYAFSSDNVIWIVGTHKIVPTMEEGMRRLREYSLPLENERMQGIGQKGSTIGKILIFEREILPTRKVHLIFVNRQLGF
jgi:L-lactate utilization protein LutC